VSTYWKKLKKSINLRFFHITWVLTCMTKQQLFRGHPLPPLESVWLYGWRHFDMYISWCVLFRMTLGTVPHPYVTSHRGHCPLLIRIMCITWRYRSYALRTHICGRGSGTKKTKAIRCGACYYSIVFTRIGCTLLPFNIYMSDLRHIHDPALSSLKMEGIRFLRYSSLSHALHISAYCS
jgi:hypothetical protein